MVGLIDYLVSVGEGCERLYAYEAKNVVNIYLLSFMGERRRY
jgi:hypothetical protein